MMIAQSRAANQRHDQAGIHRASRGVSFSRLTERLTVDEHDLHALRQRLGDDHLGRRL
jgi:hypothetical protein